MSLREKIVKWFRQDPQIFQSKYTLYDVFGCPESPPKNCPSFLERSVHVKFQNAIKSYNIIVVYGESRQGKTWTIERYCPEQLRIGCTTDMDTDQLRVEMLHAVGLDVHTIEHSVTEEYAEGCSTSSNVGTELLFSAGLDASLSASHKETLTTTYDTVDLSKSSDFFQALKERSAGKFFVFDNFHYLTPQIQQQFCSLLKEFNYHGIRIIIVGVWKDASRITALAPDLVNRCEHIDVGTWSIDELKTVANKGSKALNVDIDSQALDSFCNLSANNVGIFKDYLQKYCQKFNVFETQEHRITLRNNDLCVKATEEVTSEAYKPLYDRIMNLAKPQRKAKDSKFMRLKIVIAILHLIIENDTQNLQSGLPLTTIKNTADKLSGMRNEAPIPVSNLTQELGLLHLREENRQTGINFIPLFYFDKVNKKLLILEPTLYVIKAYSVAKLEEIILELEDSIQTDNEGNCYYSSLI